MQKPAIALVLLACGSPAPSISNLAYSPQSTSAGTPTTFVVSIDFESSDDLSTIELAVLDGPGASGAAPQSVPLQNVAGMRSGTLEIEIIASFVSPGTYDIGLDVVDGSGGRSNELTGEVTVE